MQPPASSLSAAWRVAASDLSLRVTAPIRLTLDDGTVAEFPALVHEFGSASGTLVCEMDDVARARVVAKSLGYYVSGVNPAVYAAYDRATYRDTLEDWGWYGEGAQPEWYTGVNPWNTP